MTHTKAIATKRNIQAQPSHNCFWKVAYYFLCVAYVSTLVANIGMPFCFDITLRWEVKSRKYTVVFCTNKF